MGKEQPVSDVIKNIIFNSPHIKRSIGNGLLKRPESVSEYPQDRLKRLVDKSWDEMSTLEELAKRQEIEIRSHELDSTLKNIGAIWTPSGPGLIEASFKDDPYKDKKWSAFMGRKRLMYSAYLMRRVAEVKVGSNAHESMDFSSKTELNRALISQYGPTLLFNGRADENEDVAAYLATHDLIVAPEKVHILKDPIRNTLDQILSLQGEEGRSFLDKLGSESLAIVTHVPHAVRLLHLLEANNPFPPGMNVVLFPIPMTAKGVQMKRDEISGILYYTIAGNASENPYIPSNVDFRPHPSIT